MRCATRAERAPLDCTPVYRTDWGAGEPIHLGAAEIVPGADYEIEALPMECNQADPAGYSAPVVIGTTRWGDVTSGFNVATQFWEKAVESGEGGVVEIVTDVVAALGNRLNAPIKARADLEPLATTTTNLTPDQRAVVQRHVRRVQVQANPQDLLAAFDADGDGFDASWLLMQASRHRIPGEAIRRAVIGYLRRTVDDRPHNGHYRLIEAIRESSLAITLQDFRGFPRVQRLLERAGGLCDQGLFPPWATRVGELRREFYGLTPRNTPQPGREAADDSRQGQPP